MALTQPPQVEKSRKVGRVISVPRVSKRDANRKPAEELEFFGLQDNMKVLEISPAAGYWSKFVGPTLCSSGGASWTNNMLLKIRNQVVKYPNSCL